MDLLFWIVGGFFVVFTLLGILFGVFSVVWCWLSAAYAIWEGYVTAHEAHPELGIVKPEFRKCYGRYWKWVLLGAIASQYQWVMSQGFGVYKTEWFEVDLRRMRAMIHYYPAMEKGE